MEINNHVDSKYFKTGFLAAENTNILAVTMESTEDIENSTEWERQKNPEKVDEVDSLSTNHYSQMDRENEEMDEEERSIASDDETLQLNDELQAGYKILCNLMADSKKAVNWPFMESIEVSAPDLFEDYKKRIEKPMWLKFMKQQFEEHQYSSITAFVSDFRLMLENCYRFNGPDHYISKRGQKLETMLEQKLALLSRDLREKTSIDATSGQRADDSSAGMGLRRRPKSHLHHDSTVLLSQLREEEQQKVREYRRQMILDRKAEKEALVQEILDWEDSVLFGGQKDKMKAMWEIPQIGLFLFLCQGPLNIGEVMHFELERSFLMPRESSTMQMVMTTLLSTPFQRLKIDKKTLMPYKIWEQKLRFKSQQWYKVYTDSGFDVEKACSKLGLEEKFFAIVGKKNPLEKKRYHELSYYKRVWLVKGLCDYCLHCQESLRETIELQPFHDQREYMLGTDADGQIYIHFPQFCGADVRIYRQSPFKYPKLEIKPDPFDSKRKFPLVYKPPPAKKIKLKKKKKKMKKPDKPSPLPSPVRQRPSRLRQTIKTVVPIQLGQSSSETEDTEGVSDMDTNNDTNTEMEEEEENCDKDGLEESDRNDLNESKSEDRLSSGSDASTIPYCDKSDSNSTVSSRDCSRDCSRESSPYPTPSDLGLRRSARLDKFSDGSREASPLIFDSDFGLRRSGRSKARLKNIPPLMATRDLTHLLLDENSTSNSSAFGENSNSGFWRHRLAMNENSRSSDTGEESNGCDINKLFSSVKHSDNVQEGAESSSKFNDVKSENDASEVMDTNENSADVSMDTNENNSDVSQIGTEKNILNKECISDIDDAEETSVYHKDVVCNGNVNEKDTEMVKMAECKTNIETETNKLGNGVQNVPNGGSQNSVSNNDKSFSPLQPGVYLEEAATNVNKIQINKGVHVEYCQSISLEHDESSAIENNRENNAFEMEVEHDHDGDSNDTGKSNTETVNGTEANIGDCCNVVAHNGTVTEAMKPNDAVTEISGSEYGIGNEMCLRKESTSLSFVSVHNDGDEKKELKPDHGEINQNKNIGNEIKDENEEFAEIKIKKEPVDRDDIKADNGNWDKLKLENSETEYENKDGKMLSDIKNEPLETKILPTKSNSKIKNELDEKTTEIDEKQMKMEESDEEEEEEEMVPDLHQFELLADSVEGLRMLTATFAEQEPIVLRRGKKEQVMKPPPRKKCVVVLHERLQYLLKELEPWESKLQQATKRARIRLRKEFEDYVDPPQDEDDKWNTTDEETESGASGDDDNEAEDGEAKDDNKKGKANLNPSKLSKGSNSRCSTPVKIEEVEEIDVSQRGRLRKRRIIPNNVEDQFGPKKMKSIIKTEALQTTTVSQATPSSNQPIIIQSGKSQLVDYADILRQLKSANTGGGTGVSPILIKTTQGGRTVLTSVMPVGANSTATTGGVQGLRLIAPASLTSQMIGQQQPLKLSIPAVISGSGVTKVSQHPTIQNLLAGNARTVTSSISHNTAAASPLIQILPQVSNKGAVASVVSVQRPSLAIQPQTPLKSQVHLQSQPGLLNRQTTPQKVVLHSQTTPQKIILDQLTTTPKKIAPHTAPGEVAPVGKVKYYAANASTLPINVVQQLLATRGAKLQTGPNQQSILYIPMESEGQSRNVATTGKTSTTLINQQFLSPLKTSLDSKDQLKIDITSAASSQMTGSLKSPSATVCLSTSVIQPRCSTGITTNTPILPKPQPGVATSPVFNVTLTQGVQGIQIQPSSSGLPALSQACVLQSGNIITGIAKTVKPVIQNKFTAGNVVLGVSKPYLPPTSPPRYPTNETVRTLLDKRKSVDEKTGPVTKKMADDKFFPPTTYTCIASQLQGISPKPMSSPVILNTIPVSQVKDSGKSAASSAMPNQNMVVPQVGISISHTVSAGKEQERKNVSFPVGNAVQQCVITTISQAKLNTLLLQTSAAGAKSIPSLIKLPSKAVLDSAVKAVVTSVNTTLPTVNIKVPSPTSLPSIAPRRNVTKTIQTMKSPIPVAPKVVTQGSGLTSLSIADSYGAGTSRSDPVTSMRILSSASVPTSVAQTQMTAIVQNIDGKKVLTKVAPQTYLTSKGVVQMGYLTPQGMVIPKVQATSNTQSPAAVLNHMGGAQLTVKQEDAGNQTLMGMHLVQNSAGQLQLVQKTSPLLQQTLQKTSIIQGNQQSNLSAAQMQSAVMHSSVKPAVAMNSLGNSVAVSASMSQTPAAKQSVTQIPKSKSNPPHRLHSSPSPTAILPKSSAMYATTPLKSPVLGIAPAKSPTLNTITPIKSPLLCGNVELKSPLPGSSFMVPQSFTNVLNPTQSGVSQPPASPLLNMQQGLMLPGGGIQLARPAINPLGLNLLQTGVALQSPSILPTAQNINLLQNSINTAALQQMVNINPMLVNQAIASNQNIVLGPSLQVGPNRPTEAGNHTTSHFQASISPVPMSGTSLMLSVPASSSMPVTTAANQLLFQYAVPGHGVAATNTVQSRVMPMQSAVKNLSSTFAMEKPGTINKNQVGVNSKPNDSQQLPHQMLPLAQNQDSVVSGSLPEKSVQGELNVVPTTSPSVAAKLPEPSAGPKTNAAQQKLLLFSIGGQLVTGQGVPVTLSDGVLKLMPRQKIQVANQMLSRQQIQQTLAKINQAAVSGLNVATNHSQQGPVQAANQTAEVTQMNSSSNQPMIPNKVVIQVQEHHPTQDHAYQYKDKIQKQSTPPHDAVKTIHVSQIGSESSVNISQANQNVNLTGPQFCNLEKSIETINTLSSSGEPVYMKPRSHNSQYVMKPMVYSSGYIVCPRTSEDVKTLPVVSDVGHLNESKQAFDRLRLMSEKEGFIVKAPVKPGMNGKDNTANTILSQSTSAYTLVKTETEIKAERVGGDEDEGDGDNLVIDDSTTEKEAAMNLLRLANQALAPLPVKHENEMDNTGDAHMTNDNR